MLLHEKPVKQLHNRNFDALDFFPTLWSNINTKNKVLIFNSIEKFVDTSRHLISNSPRLPSL